VALVGVYNISIGMWKWWRMNVTYCVQK